MFGRKPPSQSWRTFLDNHLKTMVSVDFFVVPTNRFQILYVFLVLAHERRRIVHFAVTAHPTAEWTAQQMREAFPWDTVPRYLCITDTSTSPPDPSKPRDVLARVLLVRWALFAVTEP